MSTAPSSSSAVAGPSSNRKVVEIASNPRGIPGAPFVSNVEEFVGGTDADIQGIINAFEETSAKYRYMEVNLQQKRKGLEVKIPDIQKTLDVVRFLEARRCKKLGTQPTILPKPDTTDSDASDDEDADVVVDEDEDDLDEVEDVQGEKPLTTLYELNETLFSEAEVDEDGNVGLWLGANTMLLYPLAEAITLLAQKLGVAKRSLRNTQEDLEFLREQVTVMEVNFARVHNWDVKRRRDQKEQEANKGVTSVRSNKDQEE